MAKRRADLETLMGEARALVAESVACSDPASRVASGLSGLWPAVLWAVQLDGRLVVSDSAGQVRPDWAPAIRDVLDGLGESARLPPAVVPREMTEQEALLHVVRSGGSGGDVLALGLPPRARDVATARALLAHVLDHWSSHRRMAEAAAGGLARWRDLADLGNQAGHELNNVLNSLGLQLASLAPRGLTPEHFPELAEMARLIQDGGLRVRRFQELCRRGQQPLGPVDLNVAVRAAMPDLAGTGPAPLAVMATELDLSRLLTTLVRGLGENARLTTTAIPGGARLVAAGDALDPQTQALVRAIVRRLTGVTRMEDAPGGKMAVVVDLRGAPQAD